MKVVSRTTKKAPHVVIAFGNSLIREMLAAAMRADGYAVDEISEEPQLLGILSVKQSESEQEQLDLVIADMSLLVSQGVENLVELRRSGWSKPLILTSTKVSLELMTQALLLGRMFVFESPFELEDLRMAVKFLLFQSKSRDWSVCYGLWKKAG